MAVISRITMQKRNKDRLNIYLSKAGKEEFGFAVDQDVFVKYNLSKGLEINEKEIKELIEEDEKKKTINLGLHYLSYRMRTVHEMTDYLEKKERQPEHIKAALEKFKELGYLDDQAFASSYVRSKSATQIKGPMKLKQELKQKGVGQHVTEEAIDQFSEESEKELIQKWVDKQTRKTAKESRSKQKQKLYQQLQGKGFSSGLIQEVLQDMDPAEEADEQQALLFQAVKLERKYASKYTGKEYRLKMKQALYQKGFSVQLIEAYLDEHEREDDET
ncbi:recombination regulator RecX [Alkalicoccobacillus murimartini]|uniref:Regulatory protein RecX n=1 Tax=Alkalicoccobacillus murimartini TaxID=171685 RepID=A0ABT9YK88_9BACI|nr:recombination regulator RecX [Alkalicoccobacillus murimartini]MDQ0208268.1 regulatory protein [Alkalicoccobacillus murimartini]